MALLLDSIYQPFNKFFSQMFDGDPTKMFRFARLPRAFVDSDFLVPGHPELGPSEAIVKELFSTVVDAVPSLDADGQTLWLSPSRLSDLYHDEILGPAIPFVPDDITDSAEKQARIEAFSDAKADAIRDWEKVKALSLIEGAGVEFRPSTAIPGNWWDKTDPGTWPHQSFLVKGAATLPGQPAQPPDQLLRMKVQDNVLRTVLLSQVVAPPSSQPSPALVQSAVKFSSLTLQLARPIFNAALAKDIDRDAARTTFNAARAQDADQGADRDTARTTRLLRTDLLPDRPVTSVGIHNDVTSEIAFLPFRQRLEIQSVLAANAPTQPVVTNDVTISFDYCVVNVTRPWFHDAFINNPFWRIPGQGRGQLSSNGGHGMPALPVGFVAIKALSIQAPWTPEDISNLQQSDQFGPFHFDSKVVNGAIGHEGIQIIGWMLQTMPDLPPNPVA